MAASLLFYFTGQDVIMKPALTFFVFYFLFTGSIAQIVQFQGETIEITVDDHIACVKGEYYLKNLLKEFKQQSLIYPFIVSDELPFPDSIRIFIKPDSTLIPFKIIPGAIAFSVLLDPQSITCFCVTYFQKTPGHQMEYLLTSTRQWKKPLEFATYIVKLPLQSKIEDFSLEYNELIRKNGEQIFIVRRKNYMPVDNLRLKWKD
jgi:hypothetical protein